MKSANNQVGIAGISIFLPEVVVSANRIAEEVGIPARVMVEKYGLSEKYIAPPGMQACDMAISAARKITDTIDPMTIGGLIYCGSPYKDYQLWSCAAKIQCKLGLSRAFTFEIMNMSAGFSTAFKVARDMLIADMHLDSILLVGGSKESGLVNPANPRTHFMLDFADGGAAVLLRRNHGKNIILETFMYTDGTFYDYVKVPAGGSVLPAGSEAVAPDKHFVDVINYEELKKMLKPVTVNNFIRVIEGALARSGFAGSIPDFLVLLHTKPSVHKGVLQGLGMSEEQSFYLGDYGHMSSLDIVIGLHEGTRLGRIRSGDLVVAASAGIGYTWAATVIRWG